MSKRFYSKRSEALAKKASDAFRAGREITDIHEILRLEEKLREDHTDIISRCQLLGYYGEPTCKTPEAWCIHAEWVIRNCPAEKLASFLRVPDGVTAEQYDALKKCFLQKVKRNPQNANVAGHAARFCRLSDLKQKQKLFKSARRLAPNNCAWSSVLCYLYSYEARLTNDAKIARKAFKVGDKFIRRFERIPHHPLQVLEVIHHLFELALKMDDLKRAAQYVREMKDADFNQIGSYYKHYYKGLLSLRKRKIKTAKSQLLKYAKKGGHGRDYRLPNQLLELGEVQTVLEYLEVCLTLEFDEEQAKAIAQWIMQLKTGKMITLGIPRGHVSPLWDFETK